MEESLVRMNRIREIRENKKLSLKKTTELLKSNDLLTLTPDALAKYERGDRQPNEPTWQALANFFNVSVPYLQGIDKEIYDLKFPTKQEAIDFIHKIMKAQNIKLEDIQ